MLLYYVLCDIVMLATASVMNNNSIIRFMVIIQVNLLDTGAATTSSHIFLGRRQSHLCDWGAASSHIHPSPSQLYFMWRQRLEIDWTASLKNIYKANPRDCEEMAALKQAVQSSLDNDCHWMTPSYWLHF